MSVETLQLPSVCPSDIDISIVSGGQLETDLIDLEVCTSIIPWFCWINVQDQPYFLVQSANWTLF